MSSTKLTSISLTLDELIDISNSYYDGGGDDAVQAGQDAQMLISELAEDGIGGILTYRGWINTDTAELV